MSAGAQILAPLPKAPTAAPRAGLTIEGAARTAWRPNVFAWVATWRLLLVGEAAVAAAAGLATSGVGRTLLALTLWTIATALAALRPPRRRRRLQAALVTDLAVGCALLAIVSDPALLSITALATCSTVVSWAAGRPIDAFIAAAATGATYVAVIVAAPIGETSATEFIGNLSMFGFFALATSGFFTIAHRIGALEIAAEISRERGRYRRDLHDRLGQALCGLHFEVQAVHAVGLDEQAPERLDALALGYRDAHAMLVDLFRGGDEPMLGTNVASVIQQEARRMAQQTGTRIDVTVSGDAGRIPPPMRPHVAAITGESIHNAIKNGAASGIDIDIDVTDALVVVSVTDDGVGFDNPPGTITEKDGHYGLREMAERARIIGGEVVVASQPGFGTRVRLQAVLPDDSAEDILERDASRLRGNVWNLVLVLRTLLGAVALAQLAWLPTDAAPLLVAGIGLVMAVDIIAPALLAGRLHRLLGGDARLAGLPILVYGLLLGVALGSDITPSFMLYAPLLLLAVGVVRGRRAAARGFLLLLLVVALALAVTSLRDALSHAELEAALVYVTTLALVGMSAVQGAKLLDRLETLQIRVRYQALARLRHGLGGRTRDQLVERLDELEQIARSLSEGSPSPTEFAHATARLQHESSELKKRLREIVHTLADPSPGRTPHHV